MKKLPCFARTDFPQKDIHTVQPRRVHSMDFIIGTVGDYFDIDCSRSGHSAVVAGLSNVLLSPHDFSSNPESLPSELSKVGTAQSYPRPI